MVTAFVPKETTEGENRVAATPATVKRLIATGLSIVIEAGAGENSHILDAEYVAAGATISTDRAKSMAEADLVMQVRLPTTEQVAGMKDGASLVSFLWAFEHLELVKQLTDKKINAFAMDAIPRITRAQKHDALSSQANIAGYKAVIMAANYLPRIFPMLMTAAGTVRPSKVVIIGAGVAGLQAIATARRLGAVVEVSDVRPEVKEQTESLGATFIEVETDEDLSGKDGYAKEQSEDFRKKQQETLERHLVAADVIITTALIPYRPAPKIVMASVVEKMKGGSVIVDLAAERGGNCELTVPGEVVVKHGVTLVGTLNIPSLVADHTSEMYANNVRNILLDMMKDGDLFWDPEDDIVKGAMITSGGVVRHPKVREALGIPDDPTPPPNDPEPTEASP